MVNEMKRLLIVPLVIVIGSVWITLAVTAWRSADIIAPAIADSMMVDSPMEQIMRSREADAAAAQSGGWGWLAFGGLFCVSGGIGLMVVARPFLKELRLGARMLKRRGGSRRPSGPVISTLPRVNQVPQLMDGEQQWQQENSQSR
jgi:hypothetical protein